MFALVCAGTAISVAHAKARPGTINFASSGTGPTAHLCSELLKSMTAIDIVHIPYKGSAPALSDVIGGQVQMLITGVSRELPHARSGKLRPLDVTSARRLAALPDIPPSPIRSPVIRSLPATACSCPAARRRQSRNGFKPR